MKIQLSEKPNTASSEISNSVSVVKKLAWYMMAVVLALTIGLYATGVDHWYYTLPGIPVFGLALWINDGKRYPQARLVILVGSFLLFTFWAFTHRRTGAEYGLMAVLCSIPMVFRQSNYLRSLLAAVGATLLLYLLYDRLTPFVPNPTINYPVLSATVLVMAGGNVFVQIILYRNTLLKYLSALRSKNEELDTALKNNQRMQGELESKNEEMKTLTDQLNWIVKQKTRELQTYIDAINVNIYSSIVDTDGNFVKINEPLLAATGYAESELIGQNFRLFDPGSWSERSNAAISKSLMAGNVWRGEVRYRTKNGDHFWGDQVVIPVKNNGGAVSYFLTLGLPITERKMNEEMRNKTLLLLQKLAFDTSHNVRGPIARLLGLGQLVQNNMVEGAEQRYVMEQIVSTTHELNLVTSEFVEFLNTHRDQISQQNEISPSSEPPLVRRQ